MNTRLLGSLARHCDKHHARITVLILLTVVIAGFFYSQHLGDEFTFPDEKAYFQLAGNLATLGIYSEDGQHSNVFWPPGHVLLMTPYRAAGFNARGLRVVNFCYLAAAIYLLGRFLRKHHSATASIFATGICAVYPILFYAAGTLYPQVTGSLLLISILSLMCGTIRPVLRLPILGGLTGLLILAIPVFLLIIPLAYLWALFSRTLTVRQVTVVAIVAGIVVGSWTIRNYVTFREFALVSVNGGANLLIGNSKNTTPGGGVMTDISDYQADTVGMNLFERDRYFMKEAVLYATSHPGRTAKMYFLKFLNYFNYRNELATEGASSWKKDLILLLSYGPLLLIFLLRFTLFRRYRPHKHELLFALLYVGAGLVYAIFFTRIRFRIPFDMLMIATCSIWVGGLIDSLKPLDPDRRDRRADSRGSPVVAGNRRSR